MNTYVIKYIDDILLSPKKLRNAPNKHLECSCQELKEYKFYANGRKHGFGQLKMKLLGHALTEGGVTPYDYKMEEIKIWEKSDPKITEVFLWASISLSTSHS